jgi:hypothetical protein
MSPRQAFGGLLATILLALFVFLWWEAFDAARMVLDCGTVGASCESLARGQFTAPMATGFNTIGGLIAAIVVAELAITKPSEVPAARLFATPGEAAGSGRAVKIAALTYLTAWVLTGLAAYLWAALLHPDALRSLTDYGNAWFGLAIASGYSYFGVNRGA